MFSKNKRIQDKELISYVKTLPCTACGANSEDAHHVKSVGSGGDDVLSNLMPLCREHHSQIHQIGPTRMMERYPQVENWLYLAGLKYG